MDGIVSVRGSANYGAVGEKGSQPSEARASKFFQPKIDIEDRGRDMEFGTAFSLDKLDESGERSKRWEE